MFKGHTLVVPRRHVVTLPDLPADLRSPFLEAGQWLASAMVDGLGAQARADYSTNYYYDTRGQREVAHGGGTKTFFMKQCCSFFEYGFFFGTVSPAFYFSHGEA